MTPDPSHNPYAPPGHHDAPRGSPAAPAGARQRGGCLTAFLVLMLIVNPLTGAGYFFGGDAIRAALHGHDWAGPVLGVMSLLNVAWAVGVWRFKRWGVYGFVAASAVGFVVNLSVGTSPFTAGMGLLGPALLVALTRCGGGLTEGGRRASRLGLRLLVVDLRLGGEAHQARQSPFSPPRREDSRPPRSPAAFPRGTQRSVEIFSRKRASTSNCSVASHNVSCTPCFGAP